MDFEHLAAVLLLFLFCISRANSKRAGDGSKSDLLRQVNRGDASGAGKHADCSSSFSVSADCINHQFNSSQAGRGVCTVKSDCVEIAKSKGYNKDFGCATKGQSSICIACNIASEYQKAGFTVDGCGLSAVVWFIITLVNLMVLGAIIGLSCAFCAFCPLYKYRMARRNRQVQPGPGGQWQGYGYPGGGPGGAGGQPQKTRPGYPSGPPPPHYTPSPNESQNPGPSPSPSAVVNPKSSTGGETEELSVLELSSTKVPSKKGKKSKSTKKTKSKKGKGKKSPK